MITCKDNNTDIKTAETPSGIDYIFVGPQDAIRSGQITVKSSRVVMKEIIDGVHAGDHYGIYSEVLVGGL